MTKKHTTPSWLLIALPLLFAVAGFTSSSSKFPHGVYTSTVTKDDLPADLPEEAKSRFIGKWEWAFTEGGRVNLTLDGKVKVEGQYTSTADQLKITDEKGEIACSNRPGSETGTYKWTLEGKKLTLTAVEDKCEGRRSFLTRVPWSKEK